MRVAVLGGGNGSFAAAADFSFAGHETRLWRRDRDAVAAHRTSGNHILLRTSAANTILSCPSSQTISLKPFMAQS